MGDVSPAFTSVRICTIIVTIQDGVSLCQVIA
ncbi:hypothetical protein HNP82_001577 [Catenibacillus scindens]|uniref:Uncharacterized protein n=1 Tax=Catenibacillus scindens TaxID=673271 RepID=A0A7W8HA30_9FIRM|nr:hypothetical protein [Catenibacillus scindens]